MKQIIFLSDTDHCKTPVYRSGVDQNIGVLFTLMNVKGNYLALLVFSAFLKMKIQLCQNYIIGILLLIIDEICCKIHLHANKRLDKPTSLEICGS